MTRPFQTPFALALLLLVASSCDSSSPPPKPLPPDAPNIVLISIDTARADRFGCYGGSAPTPNLDELASQGARFENAYATAPVTFPSHTSMLTGTYPPKHGIKDNGLFRLGDEAITVAETLSESGYTCAGFIAAFVLDSQFGLDQGFELWDDDFQAGVGGTLGMDERHAQSVTDSTLGWLEKQEQASPFFLFVHYFDPHQPLTPPESFRAVTSDPYDAEISFVDQQIGRLLESLERPSRDTLIFVTADHGEGNGDHREKTHGTFIYNSTMRVPLIVQGPKVTPGTVIDHPVSSVDIVPTILDSLELPIGDHVEGQSLVPALRGEGSLEGRPIYMETFLTQFSYGWAPLSGVIIDDRKYISAPRPELYDLSEDPAELDDLIAKDEEGATQMRRSFASWVARITPDAGETWSRANRLSPDAIEKLEALGYISTTDGGPPSGVDPKDGIEETILTDQASFLQNQKRYDEAAEAFRKVLTLNPRNAYALQHLGSCLVGAHRYAEAIEVLEDAIERRPLPGPAMYNLAHAHSRVGNEERALELIDEIRTLNPKYTPAHQWLGIYYEGKGHWKEALAAFETFLSHWQKNDAIRASIEQKVMALRKRIADE